MALSNQEQNRICKALGLPDNTVSFTLHCGVYEAATVDARILVESDSGDIEEVLSTYELMPRDEGD